MVDIVWEPNQNRIIDLQAGAHVMVLETGLFCISHAPGQQLSSSSGLPGVRISRAPGVPSGVVEISTFEEDGWIGGTQGAALVRVRRGPAGVMVTTYRDPNSQHDGPRLQVMRLSANEITTAFKEEQRSTSIDVTAGETLLKTRTQDIQAHIQHQGDCGVAIGEWIGTPGSQAWIEGFTINPSLGIKAEDIEYQAVLGKGWLSPWVEGGHFCGSRGMSLPILGLCVRLKGVAVQTWRLRLRASFTDGSCLGPVEGMEEALESESLAPLEAFCLEFDSLERDKDDKGVDSGFGNVGEKSVKNTSGKGAGQKGNKRHLGRR